MKLIDLKEPYSVSIERDGIRKDIKDTDCDVKISENGVVTVGAPKNIAKVILSYKASELKSLLCYGEAWERSYANLTWHNEENKILPWYCMFLNGEELIGYGVKVRPDSFCSWTFDGEKLSLTLDLRSGTYDLQLNGRKINAATLVSGQYFGDAHDSAHKFCKAMCDKIRPTKYPVYGGNDWYCNYGNNDFDKIARHADRIAACSPSGENRPFMVVDAGWGVNDMHGCSASPWLPNERFGDMQKMASRIAETGDKPGIWYRPLTSEEEHTENMILSREGKTLKYLDPSDGEVIEKIKNDIKRFKEWGYKLVKHDFTSFDISMKWFRNGEDFLANPVNFHDKTRTTAQIMNGLYDAIREAAGDDMYIIGCNTFNHLSAGIFEIQRIGDDTSGQEWQRTKDYGINTLAFRSCQHDAFFAADSDCVGITDMVPWEKTSIWLDMVSKSGTPLFISLADNMYTETVKEAMKVAFERAAVKHNVSKALDWTESITPCVWESDFGKDKYEL